MSTRHDSQLVPLPSLQRVLLINFIGNRVYVQALENSVAPIDCLEYRAFTPMVLWCDSKNRNLRNLNIAINLLQGFQYINPVKIHMI